MSNQWRISAGGGAFALDYNPLFSFLDRMGLSDEEWDLLFADIQIIESEVLEIWAEEREKNKT